MIAPGSRQAAAPQPADMPASVLRCTGCGRPAPEGLRSFRCERAGADETDHVIARVLDLARVRFPEDGDANPFVRYRELLHPWHVARARGIDDADFISRVARLDRAIAAVDGRGFAVTPFGRSAPLSQALGFGAQGGIWVKDETGNVAGSHKARHLMGVALYLEVLEATGGSNPPGSPAPRLAIASCGNAALAAAVVASAAGRDLDVFVPPDADPGVVERLRQLGAQIEVCPRSPGERGDPCMHAFRRALDRSALPFSCQGSENGLAVEGGQTLGYEIVSALRATGGSLDRVFVQVGGGALASAVFQAFREALTLGQLAALPKLHTIQTQGAHPLQRAWERVCERALRGLGGDVASRLRSASSVPAMAARLAAPESARVVQEALAHAAAHRSEYMWPWESTPRSVAHGILDDETYDWRAVVTGMIESGGYPVVVSEATLREANALARSTTGVAVSHTGSAGLAGLIELGRGAAVAPEESVAVLFTGVGHRG